MTPDGLIAENEFGRYHVPRGVETRPAAKAVLSGRVWEPDTIRFMQANAGTGDIIHAGTFFGDFIPALSRALAPDATLWAFEPNPASFAAAQETISLNALENVTLTNAGLSHKSESALFKTRDEAGNPLGGISHFVEEEGDGVDVVDAVMLDYVVPLERPVSILQLDVEGHEQKALRGAYHIINRWRPILILEYFKKPLWIQRTFRGLGYDHVAKVHENHVYAPPERRIVT